jgi:pilus assembly protein CpaE
MALLLRLAIVDPNDRTRRELMDQFVGIDAMWFERECSQYDRFRQLVEDTHPDIALVCLDSAPGRAIELIEEIHAQTPQCAVCAISSSHDVQQGLQAMRAGAREFLTLPLDMKEVVAAFRKLASRSDPNQRQARQCTTIAVAGTAGGVGSTSVAVNLASILAGDPSKSVALLDLDLALGDADVYLDARSDHSTLVDIAESFSRLDFDLLQRSLTKLKSGLFLLPRPQQLMGTHLVTEQVLRGVFGLLEVAFSHVVVDVSKAYNSLDLAALQAANTVLLVTQLSLPNLRNVIRLLRSFRELGGLDEKVKIVVNRLGREEETVRRKKAEEIIGREIFWELPNEYRLMVEVCNNGVPLIEAAPRAAITRELLRLAENLAGDSTTANAEAAKPTPAPSRNRWLGLWPTTLSRK